MRLFQSFRNLRIQHKLLAGYSAVFILCIILGSLVVYSEVRQTLEANIESELQNTTTTLLNMVRTSAATSIKNHLRAVAEKNRDIAAYFHRRALVGDFSQAEARRRVAEILLAQPIGTTGYIYCLDSAGVIDVHPKQALIGANLSEYAFIREQTQRKEGYLEYDWKNPGENRTRPKALYMTYFKPWDWIISVSSYREEFRELVNVEDFRDSILSLQFGETGYSYIIDEQGNMVLHPQVSGNYLHVKDRNGREFVREICARKSGKTIYSWENPGEDKARDKLVIFNHIPEYHWIVASSSYLDEFYAPLKTMRRLVLATVVIAFILVLPLTLIISNSITTPLRELMHHFSSGASGDYHVRMQRRSRDEIGRLADYFNQFMERLEDYSSSLENEIRERERLQRYLASIIDSMPSVLVGVDRWGRVTQWNREAEKATGVASSDARDQQLARVYPLLAPLGDMVREAIRERAVRQAEKVAYPVGGQLRYADIMIYPLNIEAMEGAVIRVDDVTARVRLEDTMVQTEKMLSVGGLAAGMAHEINNPLSGILQSAQNISRRLDPSLEANSTVAAEQGTDLERIRGYLEARGILRFIEGIRQSGERASTTVSDMLHFSRPSDARMVPTALDALLEKTVALAAHDYDLRKKYDFRDIEIRRDFAPELPLVPCVATEIGQVILNLLRNASQALGAPRPSAEKPCITLRLRKETDYLRIEVADNGPGMDEETRKRVFEPFFTTKDVGVGTGLGLSVSYFIVTSHHQGTMTVDSAPGQGARFIMRLPLSTDTAAANGS
jgi:PAS domain S-box-containing protein